MNFLDNIINGAKREVWVTFQKVGFHYFLGAATEEQYVDVSYLSNKHRHLFKFRVSIEVFHQDREVEFHQFLNYCESLFDSGSIDINHKSVEMLADDLFSHIHDKYPMRKVAIEISEDGECGAQITYNAN